MYEAEKVVILKDILGTSKRSGHEILFGCPFCKHHKLKLSININKNKWKCWICNSSGKSISYLVKKLATKTELERWKQYDERIDISSYDDTVEYLFNSDTIDDNPTSISLPKEYKSLITTNTLLSKRVKNYLKARGLNEEIFFKYSIGYCSSGKYEGRIIFPSFDMKGDINYFVSRTYTQNFIKYLNPEAKKSKIIFNELFIDFKKPITIVEGIFDSIKAGENSIPLLGSTLEENSLLFKRICENQTEVFLSLDKDARKKENNIISTLLKYGITVNLVRIDNEKYKDIGEMPLGEFEKYKNNSHLITDQLDLMNYW